MGVPLAAHDPKRAAVIVGFGEGWLPTQFKIVLRPSG
jgi:hypothetical protein